MTIQLGLALKNQGIKIVCDNNAEFLSLVKTYAKEYSLKHGSVTCDIVRAWAMQHKLEPIHRNAWGGMFSGKGWKCVGRVQSAIPTNHAREIRVWKWIGENR